MADFNRIGEGLNSGSSSSGTFEITLVTLGGVNPVQVQAGTTVRSFKYDNDLQGKKFVNENGDELTDSYVFRANDQVFISAPKENGKN